MVGFLVAIAIYIAGSLIYEFLRPKQKFETPSPSGLGDIQFPTIEAGRPVPIFWGTVKLSGPAVVWYGDLQVVPIKKKVKTGLFSSEEITTGYKYYLGVDLVFASGVLDDVIDIWFDERAIPFSKVTAADRFELSVNQPDFFGGQEEEGGISGSIYVYRGTQSQGPDDYLEAKIGEDLPAHRGITHAVFRGLYVGTTPYLKAFTLIGRRLPNGLGLSGGAEDIDGDANPAAMIFDIITSPPGLNGLGLSLAVIDLDNFRAVGATLKAEGLGLSMLQDAPTRGRDLILDILRHIDAMMYVEPTTGLLRLVLIRQDYDPLTLPLLSPSNCTVKMGTRPSWGEVKNVVRIRFVDRAGGFREDMVQAQELAAIDIMGGAVNIQNFDFRGFSSAANAQRAVGRCLAAVAYPLSPMTIEVDRSGWDLRPGMVRRLDWAPLGIVGRVVRVVRATSGSLEDGTISLDVMEDVFGVPWTAYEPPPSSAWTDPAGPVEALTAVESLEAPYAAVAGLTPGPETQARAVVLAARGSGVTKGYRASVNWGAGWEPAVEVRALTPSGLLAGALTELSSSIVVGDGIDTGLLASISPEEFASGVNVLLVDGEFIAFRTVTPGAGTFTLSNLARGCIDSVPAPHSSGARVWFLSLGSGLLGIGPYPYASSIRFQAFNNRSEIPAGSASTDSVSTLSPNRGIRPYVGTDVRFNALAYPASISGQLTVSWEHRDRLAAWSYADSGKVAAQEAGVVYDVLVWGELGGLVHTELGVAGKTWTYPSALEISESGLGRLNNHLTVRLEARRVAAPDVPAFAYVQWAFDRV